MSGKRFLAHMQMTSALAMLVPRGHPNAVGATDNACPLASSWQPRWHPRHRSSCSTSCFRILAMSTCQPALELQDNEDQGLHQLCQAHAVSSFFELFHWWLQTAAPNHIRIRLLNQSWIGILNRSISTNIWTYATKKSWFGSTIVAAHWAARRHKTLFLKNLLCWNLRLNEPQWQRKNASFDFPNSKGLVRLCNSLYLCEGVLVSSHSTLSSFVH